MKHHDHLCIVSNQGVVDAICKVYVEFGLEGLFGNQVQTKTSTELRPFDPVKQAIPNPLPEGMMEEVDKTISGKATRKGFVYTILKKTNAQNKKED